MVAGPIGVPPPRGDEAAPKIEFTRAECWDDTRESATSTVSVEGMAIVCDFCGRIPDREAGDEDGDALPLTWSTAVEGGRNKVFCAVCSRDHVRAMESKLDSEWW